MCVCVFCCLNIFLLSLGRQTTVTENLIIRLYSTAATGGKRKERNATRPRCQGWQSANRKCLPRATFLALWGGVPFFFVYSPSSGCSACECVCVCSQGSGFNCRGELVERDAALGNVNGTLFWLVCPSLPNPEMELIRPVYAPFSCPPSNIHMTEGS